MAGQTALPTVKPSAIAIAVSAACAGGQQANAQDTLEEIVVTATKRTANLQDVPLAITAFSSDDIIRQGLKKLDDYVGQIPGLSFSRREPAGTTVLMRGCAVSGLSFSDTTTTSVYLDEQPITVAGRNPDPRLIDIERVEALSGPQGTLFGDASQCGSLRIITNKPDTTNQTSWIDLEANTISGGDTGYNVSAMTNIPLVEGRVALRLVGFLEEEAGYIDNVLASSPGGTFDNAGFVEENINSATNSGARVALRVIPNDNWTVDGSVIFQKKELDGYGDTDIADRFFDGRQIGDLEQIRFNEDRWEDEWYQVALTAEGSLGFADLLVTGSFFNREIAYEADATTYQFAFNQLSDYYGPNYTIYDFGGDPQGAFAFNIGERDRWTFEARLSTPSESTSRWNGIVGFFYNKVESHTLFFSGNADFDSSPAFAYLNYLAYYYDPTFPLPAPPSGGNWFTGVYDENVDQLALFGEIGFEVTENFNITAGGRFFDIETDRTLRQGALFPVGTEPDCSVDFCFADAVGSSSETGFVPKITLDYRLSEGKMVYGTYSEGFRRGGSNAARPSSVFGPGNEFHEFDSDTIKNFEAGIKSTWADGRFRLNATVYHMIWEDIQLQANDPNIFTLGVVNFPEAEINGVEANFDLLPGRGWEVSGSLGWNDAEISKSSVLFEGSANETAVTEGTQLPLMPDWKTSLSVQYTLQREIWGGSPYLRVDHTYQGEGTSSLEGLQSIIFVNPVRILPSYTITNLRFGIDGEDWSAGLFLDNAFDERATQFFNDRWAQTRRSINRPRTFGLRFRKSFE